MLETERDGWSPEEHKLTIELHKLEQSPTGGSKLASPKDKVSIDHHNYVDIIIYNTQMNIIKLI